mgnify:CR=1 FL=1
MLNVADATIDARSNRTEQNSFEKTDSHKLHILAFKNLANSKNVNVNV